MEAFLVLGFLVGMQHALEADHLVAVSTLATEGRTARGVIMRGAVWGVGHTVTLFAMCAAVVSLGLTLGDREVAGLELAVGVMLILLGLDVLRRLRARRVHVHVHRHDDGVAHVHVHSHDGTRQAHDQDPHEHVHPRGGMWRALLVGLVHGTAGSAALLALALATTRDASTVFGYVLAFGLGSVAGMAALSAVMAWPLIVAGRGFARAHAAMCIAASAIAIGLGATIIGATAPVLLALE